MKSFILLSVLLVTCYLNVAAQRAVDIKATQLQPDSNFAYTRGDDLFINIIIENQGPDLLLETDSVAIALINVQGNAVVFNYNGKPSSWLGFEAKRLAIGDTMHLKAVIPTNDILTIFKGEICSFVYPCPDSIGAPWLRTMDSKDDDNINCVLVTEIPTSVSNSFMPTPNVRLYPNPVGELLEISMSGMTNAEVHIYDLNGRKLELPRQATTETIFLNTSSLIQGIYMVELRNSEGIVTKRFVKE